MDTHLPQIHIQFEYFKINYPAKKFKPEFNKTLFWNRLYMNEIYGYQMSKHVLKVIYVPYYVINFNIKHNKHVLISLKKSFRLII